MSVAAATCVILSRHKPDEHIPPARVGLLCKGHARKLDAMLTGIPELIEDLLLAHQCAQTLNSKVSGSHDPGLRFRAEVVDVTNQLHKVIARWAQGVRQTLDLVSPHDTFADQLALLLRHLAWLRALPEIAAFHDELEPVLIDAKNIAFPSGRRRIEIHMPDGTAARCLDADRCEVATRTEVRCEGSLTAVVAPEDTLLPSWIECNGCGRRVDAARWLSYGRRLHKVAA